MTGFDFLQHIRLCTLTVFNQRTDNEWSRGSGFVMAIEGQPTLVTATHVIRGKPGPWFLQLNRPNPLAGISGRQTLVPFPLGEFYYLESVKAKAGERPYADFAMCPIDISKILEAAEKAGIPAGTPIFQGAATGFEDPAVGEKHFFLASVCVEIVRGIDMVVCEEIGELNMIYQGMSEGEHEFKVAGKFRPTGYHGASGAPIFNERGRIVSLLSRGVEEDGCLYGTPAQVFLRAMNLHQ